MVSLKKTTRFLVGFSLTSIMFAFALPSSNLSGTGKVLAAEKPQYGGSLHIAGRDWGPSNWDPYIAFHITALPSYDGILRHDPMKGPL